MKDNNLQEKYQNTRAQLERAKHELFIFYEISNVMRTTLKLEPILYIILTSVTSKEGLGFDRAFLFLINEDKNQLEGKMAIGPRSGRESDEIWHQIKLEEKTLEDLVESYQSLSKKISKGLSDLVKKIKIPLNEDEGIPALTALESMPHKINISSARQKVNSQILDVLQPHDFAAVPLEAKDKTVGVIMADNIITHRKITQDDVKILSLFANQAGLAIENSRLYENMKKKAESDSLTGLVNHGKFQGILDEEFRRARRYKGNLSLIFMDIDNFKEYNDTLGHQAGDRVLVKIADILNKNARKLDIAARYGGEEFAIILPQTNKSEAKKVAERIRKAVAKDKFEYKGKAWPAALTVSIGVAAYSATVKSKEVLIKKADKALYRAKKTGKNKVVLSS